MNSVPAEEHLLHETQAACFVLFVYHIHRSHATLFSGYLLTITVLWDLGYKRLVKRHCPTCYLLFHWLLRAEGQFIEPEPKLMMEP